MTTDGKLLYLPLVSPPDCVYQWTWIDSFRYGLRAYTKLLLIALFKLPAWEPVEIKSDADVRLLPPTVQTELEVITTIDNLSNTVIANAASRSLARSVHSPTKLFLTYLSASE